MNAPDLLNRITAAGVRLAARDGKIIASPRAAVTPEMLELIQANKQELLAAIDPHSLITRAVDMLRDRPADVRAIVGKPRPDGRCMVEIAVRAPAGSIQTVVLDALIDPFILLELVERHTATVH
jgi:hypothetical protein